MDRPYLDIRGVSKEYGSLKALSDINITIERGELFSLLGSSGCGKTTLLRAMAGFVRPDSGEIRIDGKDMIPLPPYERPVNMVFQSYALFPHMTVEDNIAFGLRREGVHGDELRRRVGEALELIRMTPLRRRMPQQLSGGQRQRVALARAVVKRPQVLLLDEPLSALDKKLRESTRLELVTIQEQLGITFVLVTHDQEEALTMSARVAVMSEGRIVQVGTPSDIYERPQNRFVADFIGSVNLFDGVIGSAANGNAVLRCDALGADIKAQGRDVREGQPMAVAVRPEQILIVPADEPFEADNMIPGTVINHSYAGDKRRYHVRLSGGVVALVSQLNRGGAARALRRDESVLIGWPASAGVLVRP